MKQQVNCYIEEYNEGRNARLRDKNSNIKVSFVTRNAGNKSDLLRFLSSAKLMNLDVYNKDGEDYVFVEGNVISTSGDEMMFAYDETLTYIFK